MGMSRRVDLTDYPKFWVKFRENPGLGNRMYVSAMTMEEILLEDFGLEGKVYPNDRLWCVHFEPASYTAFIMRYA